MTSKRKLNTAQLRILEFLQSYHDPETGECTPSIKEIADAVGLSRAYVTQLLRKLRQSEVISAKARWYAIDDDPQCAARTSNLYKVLAALLLAVVVGSPTEAKGSGVGSQIRPYVTSRRRRFLVPEFC